MPPIAPWVPLLDSCLAQAKPPHTFTFATVTKDGRPQARTCVMRTWLFNDKSSNVLAFSTDSRMDKVHQLKENDHYEACFYFPEPRMQFRISGRASLLSRSQVPTSIPNTSTVAESDWPKEFSRVWELMSREMKAQFRKPAPKSPISDDAQQLIDSIERGVDGAGEDSGLDNFMVVYMIADSVDLVNLLTQRRTLFARKESEWIEEEVCP